MRKKRGHREKIRKKKILRNEVQDESKNGKTKTIKKKLTRMIKKEGKKKRPHTS